MSSRDHRKRTVRTGAWTGAFLTTVAALIIGCGGGGNDTSITGSATGTATASATGTNATNTTTTTTTSTTGNGILPQNVIFYTDSVTQANNTTVLNYNYVAPTAGSTPTQLISLSTNFGGIALNAVNQTKYFAYTADPSNPSYGIYSNSTYSFSGAIAIVQPNSSNPYVYAGELQVSPDGTTLYFLAAQGANEPQIFSVPVGGGVAPAPLDFCLDTYQLNQAGNQLVYGKVIGGTCQIFTRGIAATSTPVQITNNTLFNSDEPQWNKAGTKIAFTADPPNGEGDYNVYTMNPDGSGVTRVTDTANQSDHTPSFNGAGSQLCFMSYSGGSISTQGIFTVSLGGATDLNRTLVLSDPNILTGTYWTTAQGRGTGKGWSFLNNWRKLHPLAPQRKPAKAS